MNKKALIDAVAKETELKKQDVREIIDGISQVIPKVVGSGEKVSLVGFALRYLIKR